MDKEYLDKFKNGDLIICCKTYEDAKSFIEYCFHKNIKWFDGCKDVGDTFWEYCKGSIYYTYSNNMLWWDYKLKDKNLEYVYSK